MDTKTLIDKIAANTDMPKEKVTALLDSLVDITAGCCSELDCVAIPGFGTFEPKKRLERVTVHPTTGRRLLIPPKITLSFRPSALLKQKIKSAN